jgi:hypothetical protein
MMGASWIQWSGWRSNANFKLFFRNKGQTPVPPKKPNINFTTLAFQPTTPHGSDAAPQP